MRAMHLWVVLALLDVAAAVVHLHMNQSLIAEERGPRIYFLFLAVDKIFNLEVWTAFFNSADKEQYRAFAHCKEQSCQQQLAGSPIMPVPTVPSKYCKDLVSPMNQLLSYALSNDLGAGNARDKFAFVSDSTLPAKPFLHIHQVWSQREGSDFCVAPPADWAEVPAGGDAFQMAVKTSQWSTLTREHAQRAVEQWQKNVMRNLMIDFEMNQRGGKNSADKRNTGCLDEFWFVTVLFGPLKRASPDANEPIDLPRFTGSPLQIDHKAGWQGQCDTFVIWAKHTNSLGQNSTLDPASIPHGATARPGWWDTISMQGIQAIRKSDFLFARKFIDKPSLHDGDSFAAAYTRIIVKDDLP
ncbi:unnamed protein product [Durusdinium trenchii]|uniref:Phospholipase B-like n=1 Tax=Durusdinium trenchii TaxID=1381693 RepID=A0ABP0LBE8_9DINO